MAIKKTYLFIVLLLACTAGMGQNMTFVSTPITGAGNFSLVSSPTMIDGNSKCLSIVSGASVVNTSNHGKGEFGASCLEVPPTAILASITSINVYPNPAHEQTILKCEGQFDANLYCQVRVLSIDGKVLMSKMVLMKELVAGYTIHVSSFANATYVISVDFMNKQYARKLIKI